MLDQFEENVYSNVLMTACRDVDTECRAQELAKDGHDPTVSGSGKRRRTDKLIYLCDLTLRERNGSCKSPEKNERPGVEGVDPPTIPSPYSKQTRCHTKLRESAQANPFHWWAESCKQQTQAVKELRRNYKHLVDLDTVVRIRMKLYGDVASPVCIQHA